MNGSTGRLDSWKEIADYVGREVRTVIRWEKERGLPVHRLPGDKRSAVYAFRREIDAWIEAQAASKNGGTDSQITSESASPTQSPAPHDHHLTGKPGPQLDHSQRGTTPFFSIRRISLLAIALFVLILAGYGMRASRIPSSSGGPVPLASPLTFVRQDFNAGLPADVAAADFNGDGKLDLVLTNRADHSVNVLLGEGNGTFARRVTSECLSQPERLAVGDFDGDGKLDIAVTAYKGPKIQVLLGDGQGAFHKHFEFDIGGRGRWIASADLNRDGKMDLVVSAATAKKIFILMGNGDGTFDPTVHWDIGAEPAAVVLADFNGDGLLDVAVNDYQAATASTISVSHGNGDGTFRPRTQFPTGIAGPLGLVAADLNRDGSLDLISANFPDKASVLFGKKDRGFEAPVLLDAGRGNGFVAAGDWNRDGFTDLLVLGEHSETASIFLGHGDGTFEPKQDSSTGRYPDGAVVQDFNGDGKLDFAVSNILGNSVSVYLNTSPEAAPGFAAWLSRFFSKGG